MVMPQPVHDLPERLELPLATGEPWWYWLGGRPALDLVNTLRERWRRRVETLVTPDDLGLWIGRAQRAPAPPRGSRARRREARELREAIDACVQPALAHEPAPAVAVATIDGWLAHAGARARLAVADDGAPVLGEREPADPGK